MPVSPELPQLPPIPLPKLPLPGATKAATPPEFGWSPGNRDDLELVTSMFGSRVASWMRAPDGHRPGQVESVSKQLAAGAAGIGSWLGLGGASKQGGTPDTDKEGK